jgi:hypothetical protein
MDATKVQALLTSLQNYSGKVKTAIDAGDAASIAEVDRLIEELRQSYDAENIEMGMFSGGDIGVAITERYEALGAGAAIDCWVANHFGKTITAATTFTLSRVPAAGRAYTFTLRLTNGAAFPITWWNNIHWSDGAKPELSANGRDTLAFSTVDGGATWDGYLLGKGMVLVP